MMNKEENKKLANFFRTYLSFRDIAIKKEAKESQENVDRYWWNIDNVVPMASFALLHPLLTL